MKVIRSRVKPPAASASRMASSMGRPSTGTSVFGTSSVRCLSRLPRPAPMMTARLTRWSATLLADADQERAELVLVGRADRALAATGEEVEAGQAAVRIARVLLRRDARR